LLFLITPFFAIPSAWRTAFWQMQIPACEEIDVSVCDGECLAAIAADSRFKLHV
jgi:hypothetical protein